MRNSFSEETEKPGQNFDSDTIDIISHRYFWASNRVKNKTVLEVGCGPGLGLDLLSNSAAKLVAGDICWESINLAKYNSDNKFDILHFDAHKLPFRDQSLEVVLCVAAIIYFDIPKFIEECHRVLKPNGLLLINIPNKDLPSFRPSKLSRSYLSVPEVSSLLAEHGFEFEVSGVFKPATVQVSKVKQLIRSSEKCIKRLLKFLNLSTLVSAVRASRRPFVLDYSTISNNLSRTQDIKMNPIPANSPDTEHRVIYFEAKKS